MKQNRNKNYFSLVVALLLIAVTANVMTGQRIKNVNPSISSGDALSFPGAVSAPTITTQKSSYKFGEAVVITGKGYKSFEKISLTVEFFNQALQQNITLNEWDVYADASGEISTTYNFNSLSALNSRNVLIIKANGAKTGMKAQTSIEASVTPVVVTGNLNCAALNASTDPAFASITSDFGFKIEPPDSGTYTLTDTDGELTGGAPSDPSNSVTVSVSGGVLTSWSATLGIDAVIVKGGPEGANIYVYNPESMGDTNLTTPNNGANDVSHLEFCYDYERTLKIIKDTVPDHPQDFTFTPSGAGAASNGIGNFTLDDDGGIDNLFSNMISFNITNFGAANPITITENMVAGWRLKPGSEIECTQTGPGSMANNTIDIENRNVTVIVEPNESVTCTFTNEFTLLTAASATISGRIVNTFSRALKGVSITATALSTGERFYTSPDGSGNYRFEGLTVGDSYLITLKSRSFRFEPDSRIVTLNGDFADVDFTAVTPVKTRGDK